MDQTNASALSARIVVLLWSFSGVFLVPFEIVLRYLYGIENTGYIIGGLLIALMISARMSTGTWLTANTMIAGYGASASSFTVMGTCLVLWGAHQLSFPDAQVEPKQGLILVLCFWVFSCMVFLYFLMHALHSVTEQENKDRRETREPDSSVDILGAEREFRA